MNIDFYMDLEMDMGYGYGNGNEHKHEHEHDHELIVSSLQNLNIGQINHITTSELGFRCLIVLFKWSF